MRVFSRGGVEDTRLEAKAKDTKKKSEDKAKNTKKIRGQAQGPGQSFRGQTLSRPRTGMFEAKDTSASVLQKQKTKKGLQNFFSCDLQKKKVFKNLFQAICKILTIQKIVLSSCRGQCNFRGFETSRPRPKSRT